MDSLTTTLDSYLVKKAPALPANIKEILVQFAPWIAIMSIVFSVPAILALFGLGALFSAMPYAAYGGASLSFNVILAIVFLIVGAVLKVFALPGLFARSKAGWNFLFYSFLLSAVYSLFTLDFFGLIIGTLISLYLLFQVKIYYK
ncbi:MAG: hypothetical protein Q8O84_02650 [Nanoarchaeota archaeon]|nr:hypothetical protein [Nanoarchaeota archaeon]